MSRGTLRWFGQSWGAPVNDPRTCVPVPVDLSCTRCDEPILGTDQGVTLPFYDGTYMTTIAYHLRCWLTEIGVPQ